MLIDKFACFECNVFLSKFLMEKKSLTCIFSMLLQTKNYCNKMKNVKEKNMKIKMNVFIESIYIYI